MAKVVNLKGEQEFEIYGVPFKNHIKALSLWHEKLYDSMSHDNYLVVETKVGWVEFHFNEN